MSAPSSLPVHSEGVVADVTANLRAGDASSTAAALAALHGRLRRLAARALGRERDDHTLETDALINETYLRLQQQRTAWRNREHFLAVAARVMRRVLVDHARNRAAQKRVRPDASEIDSDGPEAGTLGLAGILEIHDALTLLEAEHPEPAHVVELRFFGGLTHEEVARELGVSEPTVERRWRLARGWLHRHLAQRTAEEMGGG